MGLGESEAEESPIWIRRDGELSAAPPTSPQTAAHASAPRATTGQVRGGGGRAGARALGGWPAPNRALVDFARVYVPAGEVVRIPFDVPEESFKVVNNSGERVLYKGEHFLEVTSAGAGAPGRQILYVVVGL